MPEKQRYLPGMKPVTTKAHYDLNSVGPELALAGAGQLAFITRDQLHPPMVDDEEIWENGRRWLTKHFLTQFNRLFRKPIEEQDPLFGKHTADEFAHAIQESARLYAEEKLTYCRIVARKEGGEELAGDHG